MRCSTRAFVACLLAVCGSTCACAQSAKAVLTFEGPAYVDMPVWVHVKLADTPDLSLVQANMRYPFSGAPWDFRGHDFEVMRNGESLPEVAAAQRPGGRNGLGSAAPPTSPRGRLPLHLHYRFDQPGKYLVRYEYRGVGPRAERSDEVIAASEWTELEVLPLGEAERQSWLAEQQDGPPEDVGMLVGDYLPSLLAKPDEEVLETLLGYVYHPEDLVAWFAVYSLYYYPEDTWRRELPALLRERGPTEFLAYFLSWSKTALQPVGEEIVEEVIPYLMSESPAKVGGALQTLVFLRGYQWPPEEDTGARMQAAVWGAVDHITALDGQEALRPLCLFLGGEKSDRAREVLWRLSEHPSVREQALICLTWIGDARDLARLGETMLGSGRGIGSLPYHLRRAYGEGAAAYLLRGLGESANERVPLACARELALAGHAEGFEFFREAVEQDRKYKHSVTGFLHDHFGMRTDGSDKATLEFIETRLREMRASAGP
jgi:hypothetical protein